MIGRKSLLNKAKRKNWCKVHKAWVEYYPEVKGDNGCRICKKLEEEHNLDRQWYAQEIKFILIDLN